MKFPAFLLKVGAEQPLIEELWGGATYIYFCSIGRFPLIEEQWEVASYAYS